MITEELSASGSVWHHFTKQPDGLKAKCAICQINLPLVNGSVKGLQFHLQFAHKIILIGEVTPPKVESPKLEVNDVKLETKETVKKERRKKVNRSKSDSLNKSDSFNNQNP